MQFLLSYALAFGEWYSICFVDVYILDIVDDIMSLLYLVAECSPVIQGHYHSWRDDDQAEGRSTSTS